MNKHYLLLLLILFLSQKSISQSNCPNLDFSSGDFSGWVGHYGTFDFPDTNIGIVDGRHTIISTQDFDPVTNFLLPEIAPGELFSARLGNPDTGAESEKLTYTISVNSNNTLFIYKYAVVLEDPGHDPSEQPGFTIKILNNNGDVINPNCGVYDVYAGQPGQDFHHVTIDAIDNGVVWLPWKTIGIDLSNYIGQDLKIEFTTRDCSKGGHFGYAYISARCSNLKVNVKICNGDSNFTLTAPDGFSQYLWTYNNQPLGTTQSITLPIGNYVVGDSFNCALTSFSNGVACTSNIIGVLSESVNINPLFNVATTCGNQITSNPISFIDQTTSQNGSVQQWFWDFGDGTTSTEKDPQHIYLNSGTYTVILKAVSSSGCSKTYNKNIVVNNNPIPLPNVSDTQIFCTQSVPTISNFNTNGNTVFWYENLTSIDILPSSTPLIDGTTYYCALLQGNCYGPRKAVKVILKNVAVPTGESIQVFCQVEHPTLANLVVSGNYTEWHSQAQGGNVLSSSTPLLNDSTYYAFQYDPISGCKSENGFAVTVHLNDDSSSIPNTLTKQFCEEAKPIVQNLFFEGLSTIIYDNIHSNTPLAENASLNDGSTYYASIYNPTTACESEKRCAITVDIIPCDLYPYNTITINDNNQNDYLAIKNIEYFPDNHIEIYNRFGQIVFKKDNYGFNDNWFNGEANAGDIIGKNKKLPTGTYYYIINFKNESLMLNKTKKGFIYILNNE